MRHYNTEAWSAYVRGQLSADRQSEYEAHLYDCEACLQLYMDCVALLDIDPITSESEPSYLKDVWIEQIMERIESQKQPLHIRSSPLRKIALYRKPIFQYALAAAITILLMTNGIFQGITGGIGESPPATKQTLDASYTDQLMNKTVAMLDAIQLKAKLIEKGDVNHE
jgi:anti-sigma factor RsiW